MNSSVISLNDTTIRAVVETLKRQPVPPEAEGVEHGFEWRGTKADLANAYLANRIHQASMEAGERWMLNDVAGKPLYAWDNRNHELRTVYDQLRRPKETYLREGAGTPLLVGRTLYGDSLHNPETQNIRGKVVHVYDQAGLATSDEYDFKGNPVVTRRTLTQECTKTIDWSAAVSLGIRTYSTYTRYDALNRPIESTMPDDSVVRHRYNEANLLNAVEANLRDTTANEQPIWARIEHLRRRRN